MLQHEPRRLILEIKSDSSDTKQGIAYFVIQPIQWITYSSLLWNITYTRPSENIRQQ